MSDLDLSLAKTITDESTIDEMENYFNVFSKNFNDDCHGYFRNDRLKNRGFTEQTWKAYKIGLTYQRELGKPDIHGTWITFPTFCLPNIGSDDNLPDPEEQLSRGMLKVGTGFVFQISVL